MFRFYKGRGSFETIGTGIPMSPGEIAFKCNFSCIDLNSSNVIYRRVDKDFSKSAQALCEYLQIELNRTDSWLFREGIDVQIKHATDHRCGLKISKRNTILSDNVSGTDPLLDE